MKIITEIKKRKIPIVRVDNSLKEYDDKILFPDKLEKANAMLRKLDFLKMDDRNAPRLTNILAQ